MKKHKEILEEHCKIIEGAVDVMVEEVYKAMDDAATQAFKTGYLCGYDSHIIKPEFGFAEDYLKEISDGSN